MRSKIRGITQRERGRENTVAASKQHAFFFSFSLVVELRERERERREERECKRREQEPECVSLSLFSILFPFVRVGKGPNHGAYSSSLPCRRRAGDGTRGARVGSPAALDCARARERGSFSDCELRRILWRARWKRKVSTFSPVSFSRHALLISSDFLAGRFSAISMRSYAIEMN